MAKFEDHINFLLDIEGGYAHVPGDRGGPTNFGITQETYDLYRQVKGKLPRDVALIEADEVPDLYRALFWDAVRGDELRDAQAVVLFDASVHRGPPKAIKLMQEIIGAKADGIFGPKSMQALLDMPITEFIDNYLDVRLRLLMKQAENPSETKFRKGWENRIKKVRARARTFLI